MAVKQVFGRLICQCDKCGHIWLVKPKHNEEDLPRDCPGCRSIKWNKGGNK